MQTASSIYDFLKGIQALKEVERKPISVGNRKENSAEHSWSVAMTALILIPELEKEFRKSIDAKRVITMALIHDLIELHVPDVSVWDYSERAGTRQKENESFNKVIETLPISEANVIRSLWVEFQEQTTIESKIANAADRLSTAIQRVSSGQGWATEGHTENDLDAIQLKKLSFSAVLTEMYDTLKADAKESGLLK